MNQVKIGKFIADMRKKQNLSQKQLADQIGVTDKTVSKWETGSRMPDASLLLQLCSVLQIDVSELLVGEKFQKEEYSKKTETNIVNLVEELNEISNKSEGRNIGTVIGSLFIGLGFLTLVITSLGVLGLPNLLALPIIFYLLGLVFLIISISGWFYDFTNALKFCFHKDQVTEKEINASIQAIKYTSFLTLAIGWLISVIGIISAMSHIDAIISIGSALAQTVLSGFYTSILEIIYVIIFFKLRKKQISES